MRVYVRVCEHPPLPHACVRARVCLREYVWVNIYYGVTSMIMCKTCIHYWVLVPASSTKRHARPFAASLRLILAIHDL